MSGLGSIGPRVCSAVNREEGFGRGRRAAAARQAPRAHRSAPSRARRGLLMLLPLPWRRSALGTNHITSHGVWRIASRRTAPRRNRDGETRWHFCRRILPSLPVPGHPQQGAHT